MYKNFKKLISGVDKKIRYKEIKMKKVKMKSYPQKLSTVWITYTYKSWISGKVGGRGIDINLQIKD